MSERRSGVGGDQGGDLRFEVTHSDDKSGYVEQVNGVSGGEGLLEGS
jgi:hypothetical protein